VADRLEAHFRALAKALNAIVIGSKALAGASIGALCGLCLVAPLRLAGHATPGRALGAFFALVLGGSIVGVARAFPRRLDSAGAALWLDGRVGGAELFSAALFASGRGACGGFDARIVAQAEAELPRVQALRPPRRRVTRACSVATIAILAGAFASVLISPIAPRRVSGLASALERSSSDGVSAAFAGPAPDRDARSAAAIARELFPGDRDLAALAERAIAEGKAEALDSLLKRARVGLESAKAKTKDPIERKRISEEEERLAAAAEDANPKRRGVARQADPDRASSESDEADSKAAKSSAANSEDSGKNEGEDSEDGSAEAESESDSRSGGGSGNSREDGADGEGTAKKGSKSGAGSTPKDLEPSDKDGEGAERGGKGADKGGTEAPSSAPPESGGVGRPGSSSGGLMSARKVVPRATGSDAIIAEDSRVPYSEYALPGLDPRAPTSASVKLAAKSSESTIARFEAPLEFGDSVRAYFLRLAEEASRRGKAIETVMGNSAPNAASPNEGGSE